MLNGKVALVTGGSRGIGRAVVEKLAQQGASIAINFSKNEEAALSVQKIVNGYGSKSILCKADVGDYNEASNMVDKVIEEFGKIDILVNSAGIGGLASLKDMNLKDWYDIINVNLMGVFNVCKLVSNHMISRNYGKIINVSSVYSIMSVENTCSYTTAKAGVSAFTRVIAKELISHNINVNAIGPGYTDTDMLRGGGDEKVLEYLIAQVPAKRMAKPHEIADLTYYLCQDISNYIVGQTIIIDGGLSI